MLPKDATGMRDSSRHLGMEFLEITPVIVGGDPVDPKNKVLLSRQQHFEAVRYWNKIIREMRSKSA